MDIFSKPQNVDCDIMANLGPLTPLAGIWEGEKGTDFAPSKKEGETTQFKERISFAPFGPVINSSQVLYGLNYSTIAWPLGESEPYHEEVGYWLWDPRDQQVMRCFMVPRGVTLLAGAKVEPSAKSFELIANSGSSTYGILSNPFLEKTKKTVQYVLNINIIDDRTFEYKEDTIMEIKGVQELFHHKDSNILRKIE